MTIKEMLSNSAFLAGNNFARAMSEALEKYGSLTEKQSSALERCYAGFEKFQKICSERAARDASSEFVGTVGNQLTIQAKLEAVFGFDSRFGYTSIFLFRDADGNIVKWMTASRSESDFEKGETYIVKGSVKKHDTYRGAKQTVLTRCQITKPAETTVAMMLQELAVA